MGELLTSLEQTADWAPTGIGLCIHKELEGQWRVLTAAKFQQ